MSPRRALPQLATNRAYAERRTSEGLSKKDIIRCLKRLIPREIYYTLTAPNHA